MWVVAQMLDSTAGRRCGHASIREHEQLGRGNFLLTSASLFIFQDQEDIFTTMKQVDS